MELTRSAFPSPKLWDRPICTPIVHIRPCDGVNALSSTPVITAWTWTDIPLSFNLGETTTIAGAASPVGAPVAGAVTTPLTAAANTWSDTSAAACSNGYQTMAGGTCFRAGAPAEGVNDHSGHNYFD